MCFLLREYHYLVVKVMLHGKIRNDDFSRNTALHTDVVTIRNNVVTMLQPSVALKIVVANRLV